jgi:hypothetical protein
VRLDVYAEHSRDDVNSPPPDMSDDAADEHGDPDKQPWQRVQVLVTSARRGGVPASRSRPGALYPSDVEQKNATPAEKAERRATDRRPRCHKRANDGDRRKNEYAKRHEAERCGTSEKRPHPKPAASGDMSANQWSESRRIWPPSRLHTTGV